MTTPKIRRILIVDDSPEDRVYIKHLLVKVPDINWHFTEAGTGEEGLAIAESTKFDCILLDYYLPDIDAIEFLDGLEKLCGEPGCATVVLTGSGNEATAVRAIRSGAQDFFLKRSLSSWLLVNAIDNAVDRFRLLTERIEARRQLEQANAELQRSNESLQFFSYAASHDLQSPLGNIATLTALLGRKYAGKDPDGDKIIELINASLKRMQELITNLLVYAQSETAEEPCVAIPLGDVVQAALQDLGNIISGTGASIFCHDLPTVLMPVTQIQQVFRNLIENAIKYRRSEEAPRIVISAHKQDHTCIVAVRDNGQGFANEYAELIFQPFKRLHGKEYAGSGIGLATCRKVLERNQCKIWAESEPGQGSTFYFTTLVANSQQAFAAG